MSTRPSRVAAALLATGAITLSGGAVITALPPKANLVGNQNPTQFVKVEVAVPAGHATWTVNANAITL